MFIVPAELCFYNMRQQDLSEVASGIWHTSSFISQQSSGEIRSTFYFSQRCLGEILRACYFSQRCLGEIFRAYYFSQWCLGEILRACYFSQWCLGEIRMVFYEGVSKFGIGTRTTHLRRCRFAPPSVTQSGTVSPSYKFPANNCQLLIVNRQLINTPPAPLKRGNRPIIVNRQLLLVR